MKSNLNLRYQAKFINRMKLKLPQTCGCPWLTEPGLPWNPLWDLEPCGECNLPQHFSDEELLAVDKWLAANEEHKEASFRLADEKKAKREKEKEEKQSRKMVKYWAAHPEEDVWAY